MALSEQHRLATAEANKGAAARLSEIAAARFGAPPQPGQLQAGAMHDPGARGGPKLDLDTADSASIAKLPFLSPSVIGRIVADRRARGPFGSIDGLRRVPGITLAMTDKLSWYVTFSRAGMAPPPVYRFRKIPGRRAILDTLETRGQLHPSGPAP